MMHGPMNVKFSPKLYLCFLTEIHRSLCSLGERPLKGSEIMYRRIPLQV